MKNSQFFSIIYLALSALTNGAIAQQTNAKEDYTPFLPEVRALNQRLLTKEGKEADEKMALADHTSELQLKPSVIHIQGRAGSLGLRIFKPDNIQAVILDIHGGGWCAGTAGVNDIMNDQMARICKVAIVSVDYRLAPDNPFPACLNDCYDAAKWLVNHAKKEFGTDKLILSGGSSGGQLCALTTIFIRDSLHAIDKVKGVNLMYGMFDLSRTPSCRKATDSMPLIPKSGIEAVFNLVFPGWSIEQKQDPKYSPLYADLYNLPPAFFTVGTGDPLVDDTHFLEARWRLAGNKTFLAVYPECAHAFNTYPTKIAAIANAKIFSWIISKYEN